MEINLSIVAAGVAQTGLQAQQLGRRRAARAQQSYRQTREIQEVAAAHLRAVEENDEGSSAGVHVAITSDLPEHHTPEGNKPNRPAQAQPQGDQLILAAKAVSLDETSATQEELQAQLQAHAKLKSQGKDAPAMRHLDVQA